jgi:hypothetical protein
MGFRNILMALVLGSILGIIDFLKIFSYTKSKYSGNSLDNLRASSDAPDPSAPHRINMGYGEFTSGSVLKN